MTQLPENKQKYIQILGFVDWDERGNFLFKLSHNGELFKVAIEEIVSHEIIKTTVGNTAIYVAKLFITYSENAIGQLKEGTGRRTEKIYKIGPDDLHPNKVPGGNPPPAVPGGPKLEYINFLTNIFLDDNLVEIIEYRLV